MMKVVMMKTSMMFKRPKQSKKQKKRQKKYNNNLNIIKRTIRVFFINLQFDTAYSLHISHIFYF